MKYLKIILLLFIISNTATLFSQSLGIKTTIVTNARPIPRFMYGVDLDGSTEYMSNSSPINLDLNGANIITNAIDNDFELSITSADFSADVNGWGYDAGNETATFTWVTDHVEVVVTGAGTSQYRPAVFKVSFATQTSGLTYRLTFDYLVNSGTCIVNGVQTANGDDLSVSETISGTGVFTYDFTATATHTKIYFYFDGRNTFDLEITAISLSSFPNYTGTGNHSFDSTSVDPLTGTYSGKIAASGVGDSTTNFASLATDKYTTIVSGTKYTLQIEVRAVLADTDVILVIGGKAKTFTAIDQISEILVYNFEATSAEVGQKIIVYLSQADVVFIDEVDLSEAYDMTVMGWNKWDGVGTDYIISNYNVANDIGYLALYAGTFRAVITDGNNSVTSSSAITSGVWVHQAMVIDRTGDLTHYINGVLQGDIEDISFVGAIRPNATESEPLGIGANGIGSKKFSGFMGETQIIRGQILTEAEILTAFNRGSEKKHFR